MTTMPWIPCLIDLAVVVGLGNLRAHAQAEVDPDHFRDCGS
jgi:hypothetical protein